MSKGWYVPQGRQLYQLALQFIDNNYYDYTRLPAQGEFVDRVELQLLETGPIFLMKSVDFDGAVEEILEYRRNEEEKPLMKKRTLQPKQRPWEEITYSHEDLDRTIVTINMPGGQTIDLRIKGNEIMMSSYGEALSISPRAANQIMIGFKDPYERD